MLPMKGCQQWDKGKASQFSSGQSCCCSKTETCTAPSGIPKVTWDLIHTKGEAGYMYVYTNAHNPTHTYTHHTPTLDCLWFFKSPQPPGLLQELCG